MLFLDKNHTNSKTKYTKDDIVNMINFLIDNIFIEFGGRIFQQTVGIPVGTNCVPLLANLFLHTKSNLSKNYFVKEKRYKHSHLNTHCVIWMTFYR